MNANLQSASKAQTASASGRLAILSSLCLADVVVSEPAKAYSALTAARESASRAFGLLAAHRTRSSLMML